jgi:hypothetical protein
VSQPPPPPQPSPPQPHAAAAAWQLGMWMELGRVDERVLQDGEWQQQQECCGGGGGEEHEEQEQPSSGVEERGPHASVGPC